jgi:hypothetical protein
VLEKRDRGQIATQACPAPDTVRHFFDVDAKALLALLEGERVVREGQDRAPHGSGIPAVVVDRGHPE